MALKPFIVLPFPLGSIRLACAENLTTFKVTEPISIAGVPLVKLGPGSYVLRTIHESERRESRPGLEQASGLSVHNRVDDSGGAAECR